MTRNYFLQDAVQSYKWLGHSKYTELLAVHPKYRHGKENLEWNLEHNTFPRVSYAQNENDLVSFINKHGCDRMICYSLNSRPEPFRNQKGYYRSAYEDEIESSKNILLDFDFIDKSPSKTQLADFELFLEKAKEFFLDKGMLEPVKAFTGRGYHWLLAYPEITVKRCPEIAEKTKAFSMEILDEFKKDLAHHEVKLDTTTYDLRRMVKVYGTAKPDVGVISRFYGSERCEDKKFREYLLAINLSEQYVDCDAFSVNDYLPELFMTILTRDKYIRSLWNGHGKTRGDTSSSGYDFSLARTLIKAGFRNIDDLATVLALRPDGSMKKNQKTEGYLRYTIANAILKR